jgi:hypothetical protein
MDLQEAEKGSSEPEEHVLDPHEPEPVVITPFHFGLLCVASLGLYTIWWQFKCWRYFKLKEESDTFPAVRALLFLFFGISLFEKITQYSRVYDYKVNYNPIAIWAACLCINFSGYLPSPFFLLGLFAFAPMIWPLQALNFYFTGNKNGYVNDKLNHRQIVLLVAGIVCWALIIAGLVFDKDLPK